MSMRRYLAMLLALVLGSAACEWAWDAANRAALTRDIRELLGRAGVTDLQMDCHMIGTTRAAECQLRATPEQVASIRRVLVLRPVDPPMPATLPYPFSEPPPGSICGLASAFSTDPSVVVFESGRRPPELRLKNGGAFEFLLLYHQPQSAEACIAVSYAYG